ncbi:MAG: GAF domain-containing protein [Anaerolineae bacterium]|nr:GAF domain-containing protein [Anaerolineae bacterium]
MDNQQNSQDTRILRLIQAANQLIEGNFRIRIPDQPEDEIGQLGKALQLLALNLENRYQEIQKLNQLTSAINSGLLLEEVLEHIYEDFRNFIPYDRIGFSLLENQRTILRAHWARAEYTPLKLAKEYTCEMSGSSLETILQSGLPRIINDLQDYLAAKPSSESTRLMVEEGVRSSLTCPLIANGIPIGFMFFSSCRENTYAAAHAEIYMQIAGQLSVIVEKGHLVSILARQKKQLEQQYSEVQRLNNLQNTFLGIAAHDLRNPIASIQNIAELLAMPAIQLTDLERADFIHDIHETAQHMGMLLNDLLDVTSIESGKVTLDPIYYPMRKLLEDAVRRNQFLAEPKNTRIILDTIPEGTACIDIPRMRQVLDNLLSNAVKYSPPGSTVIVRAMPQDTAWRVEVQDQGPGISPVERDRLFKDFSRLSAQPTGGERSTGLGLSITRRVIEAHQGTIGVDSIPGSGSIFWFEIPSILPQDTP